MRRTIHFAITSHGFGHMTRTLAVVREFLALNPDVRAIVSTTIPEPRIARELGADFTHRSRDYEPGTAQINCFEVDVEGTRDAYRRFFSERPRRLREEIEFLRESKCLGVVSDIPALPVRAAGELGLPAAGVSNFTWDWVLEPVLEGSDVEDVPERLAEDYRAGRLYLRLPLGAEESPFPRVETAPLVGRRARRPGPEVRRHLGIPDDGRRLVVVCPGGWGADSWAPIHVRRPGGFRFLLVGGLPVTGGFPAIRLGQELPGDLTFTDLVAAADAVLTKPGYGIASECILNRTPMVAVERRNFRESGKLIEGLRAAGPFAEMSLESFFSGDWEDPLVAAVESDVRWAETPAAGAREVAERLGAFFLVAADGDRHT